MATWIASRLTADNHQVHLWPDGALTWALGHYIKGSPHPRTPEARELALRAGWLVMGEVELYHDDEVPDLIAVARKVAERGGDPGDVRKAFAKKNAPKLKPIWTTIETDRDGKPTVQSWVLPRLRWPGLAVWKEKGRYSLWRQHRGSRETYTPTGFSFANLEELTKHLLSEGVSHGHMKRRRSR